MYAVKKNADLIRTQLIHLRVSLEQLWMDEERPYIKHRRWKGQGYK